MAITRTQRYANVISAGTTATARSGNLGSLSYTAGNLVVVAVLTSAENLSPFAVTAPGWTFTLQSSYQDTVGGSFSLAQVGIFTATVPSTGSHTISVSTNGVNAYQLHAIAWEMSASAGSCVPAAVGNNGAQAEGNGAQSVTLDSAPESGSYVLCATHVDCDVGAASMTPGSGWTEDADFVSGGSNYGNSHSQYRTGSTSTTCTVNDLRANDTVANLSWAMAALEIKEVVVAPDAPTLVRAGDVYDGTVPLTWTNPSGTLTGRVVQYAPEAYPGATLSWTTFEDSSTTTANIDVTGLTNGTRYRFRVAMKSSAGTGTYGTSETGATPRKVPRVIGVGPQSAVTTGDATPAYPAGYTAVAGDVAIIVCSGRPSDTSEISTPSGYSVLATALREVGTNDLRLQAFYKVLTTSESMPAITTPTNWTGTSRGMSVRVMIVRDLDTSSLIDVAAVTSDSAAAATFRPTGLTTLTADAFVLTVAATSDNNTLAFDTTTSPASHQNYTLAAAQATTTGGDHAVAIAHRLGAVPAISTQASTADPLTAAFQETVSPTDTGNYQYLRDGAGATVFILDTGCRTSHDEFTGRIVDTWVPTGSGWTASNDSATGDGHGTCTASIVAGDTLGIARAADIVIMKMLNGSDPASSPTSTHFAEALDYIVANFEPPYIVNWSLAGPSETDASEYAAYEAALDDFAAAGGVVIVAGGNSGSDWPDLYMPDDHPCAFKIMGHTFAGSKESSSSQAVDQALSAMYGSHTTASKTSDSSTATGQSGTSFAAPIVTGTAACIAAADSTLTAAQIMDIVIREAPEGLTGFPAGYSTRKLYSNADVPGLIGVVSPPLFRQTTVGNDPWVAFTVALSPSGGGPAAQDLTLPAISDSDTLYGPSVSPGAVSVTLPAISDGDTLHAPSAAATYGVTLPQISDEDTLYGPVLAPGAVGATLPHIGSVSSLLAPTVAPGAVSVTLPLLASSSTLSAPSVAAVYGLTLPALTDGDTVTAPSVAPGAVGLVLPQISDGDTLHGPTVSAGGLLVLPAIPSGTSIHAPAVGAGAVGLTLPQISSGTSLHVPAVSQLLTLVLPHLADADTVTAPTVAPGAVDLVLARIGSSSELYGLELSFGQAVVLPVIVNESFTLLLRYVGRANDRKTFLSAKTAPVPGRRPEVSRLERATRGV